MNTNAMYASRKRRKPIQKRMKAPAEGAKSNPSKRHRDRLNGELERLANLLPFPADVISKLDKLTVLRLSVSYLRAKSFFNVTLKSESYLKPDGLKQPEENFLEGELLLQVLNGFVLVATSDGVVFYVSSTIQDYLGFHQSDIIHQNVFDLIHAEDRPEFRRQLHWALDPNLSPETGQESSDGTNGPSLACYNPENSRFLERNFVCRVRCLLDSSSGFLAMNFLGHLKFLHIHNQRTKDGLPAPPPLALFAIVSPLRPPSILEIRTKSFIFRTKHKLDFTPTACDARGKTVLGYTDAELCYRGTGYQFIHAADMLHCAENHIRMMKTGESGMTVFRLLTKQSRWVWVQANARLIYKNSKPECIIASQRVITDEEGEENLRKRNLKLPFGFTSGEAVLYDTNGILTERDSTEGRGTRLLEPNSILGAMLKQDESAYVCVPAQSPISLQHNAPADSGEDQIFSGHWQDNILSFSENGIFKREPINSSDEDKNGDLLRFMKGLGISREDLELIQQDEEFMQISLDEQGDIMNVADEILSYVQESLKTSDCIFSNTADRALSGQDSCCAPQHEQPLLGSQLHHGQPLLQPQQNALVHPQKTFPQQYLHTPEHSHSPIPQQHSYAQTQLPVLQRGSQNRQLTPQQYPHTQQQISQLHPPPQHLIPQQCPHTQQVAERQLVSEQHLHTQGHPHEPFPQQQLHAQTPPWQPISEHTLIQQRIPRQQIMQHNSLTQTYPQQTAPQQYLQHQIPQQLSCPQQASLLPLRQEHLSVLQPPQSQNLAQPLHSHQQQELALKQHPQQEGHLLLASLPEQQQLCHETNHMQVNGKYSSLKQPAAVPTTNDHPLAPLFCTDVRLPQYGHLLQDQSYLSSEGHAAAGAGTFTSQDLVDLLESLWPGAAGEQHCASILQQGSDTSLCHPITLPMHQCLSETSGLGHGQQVNPMLLTSVASGLLGHQPFLSNNGNSGGMSQTHPESGSDMDHSEPGHPLHQHPDESRPFQDLTTGGFM